MNRLFFTGAFLLGAAAVLWMASTFVGSNTLALAVTLVIACVYAIGFMELLQFRAATDTLARALAAISDTIEEDAAAFEQWLQKLHPSLQNAVRLRIEGERVGLPAPVVTPYLVGLLVMLGLLGTFVGMVETLSGAVIALEGTTELQAIRAGLAAPIQGLSVAFGTSVAGVAASAMLGLISTLSRRDRMLETRALDGKIATVFRTFSLGHNRQETYKALQMQAQALPAVAEKLNAIADQLGHMGDALAEKLIASQDVFHHSTMGVYQELAASVGGSLKESLAESARLAGESITPVVALAMESIASEAKASRLQMSLTTESQLDALATRLGNSTEELLSSWSKRQEESDGLRLSQWSDSLSQSQTLASEALCNASTQFSAELKTVAELASIGGKFSEQVGSEVRKMSGIAEHFAGSATEMASLGEAFTTAVNVFNESNNVLMDGLCRIEQSMDKSSVRSDEQMGYYVAQARQIIDQSMLSQREMFEELRQLGQPDLLGAVEEA